MVKVYCRTNLDTHQREQWPEEFVVPPRVGDYVESDSGKTLQIKNITHKMSHGFRSIYDREPMLEIYLGKLY